MKRSEAGVERAERSGGLHKRSAEAWGNSLRARGAELPLGAFKAGRCGAGTGPAEVGSGEREAVAARAGGILPLKTKHSKKVNVK